MYTAAIVQTPIGTGYQAPDQTNCQTYGNQTNCTTTRGTYTPPAVITSDANMGNRNQATKSCMYSKGYTYDFRGSH